MKKGWPKGPAQKKGKKKNAGKCGMRRKGCHEFWKHKTEECPLFLKKKAAEAAAKEGGEEDAGAEEKELAGAQEKEGEGDEEEE